MTIGDWLTVVSLSLSFFTGVVFVVIRYTIRSEKAEVLKSLEDHTLKPMRAETTALRDSIRELAAEMKHSRDAAVKEREAQREDREEIHEAVEKLGGIIERHDARLAEHDTRLALVEAGRERRQDRVDREQREDREASTVTRRKPRITGRKA